MNLLNQNYDFYNPYSINNHNYNNPLSNGYNHLERFINNGDVDYNNDNPYIPIHSNRESFHEGGNLVNSYYSNNSFIDNINKTIIASINDSNILNEDNHTNLNDSSQYEFKEEEENNSKFTLFLKNNKYIKDNKILENESNINKEKKRFESKMNKILDNIKCKVCSKIPNEFFICSLCNSFFCEKCMENEGIENINYKYCICCQKLIDSKKFIKLPIFNKIKSYINSIKENNEKIFINRIKENFDKNLILCCEDIHNISINEVFNININEIKNQSFSSYDMKASYFCMECLRPFCSDCILNFKKKHINDNIKVDNNIINENKEIINNDIIKDNNILKDNLDNSNNINNAKDYTEKKKHEYGHSIFKIELLKEIGIFDLLYEKEKSQKIISDLELINQNIIEKIEFINLKKKNLLLFLDYIKKIYVEKMDEIINNLKTINQEKNEKIKLIRKKNDELLNFLTIFKTQKGFINKQIKNNIEDLLTDFNSFHKIPYEIKKNLSIFIKFKGIINLEGVSNISSNLKEYYENNIKPNNDYIRIKYHNSDKLYKNINSEEKHENNEVIKNDDIKNNNNTINEEKTVDILYKQNINNNKREINKNYSFPILINNNHENHFILLKEKTNKDKNKKKESDSNSDNNTYDNLNLHMSDSEDIINSFNNFKYYQNFHAINIKCLKKLEDLSHNFDFDIYKLNIF